MKIPDLPWTDEVKIAIDNLKDYMTLTPSGTLRNPLETILKELVHQTQVRLVHEGALTVARVGGDKCNELEATIVYLREEITELRQGIEDLTKIYTSQKIPGAVEATISGLVDEIGELKHTNKVKDGRITFLELQGIAHAVACGVPYVKEKRKGERRSDIFDRRKRGSESLIRYGRRSYEGGMGRRSGVRDAFYGKRVVKDRRSK